MSSVPKHILHRLIDQASEGMIIADSDDAIVNLNPGARSLLDLSQDETPDLQSLFGKENLSIAGEFLFNCGGRQLRVKVEQEGGDAGGYKLIYLSEITDQDQDNQELVFLRTIIDTCNEGIIASNKAGQIVVYNKQEAEFEDLEQKQVLGKHLTDIYDTTPDTSEHMQIVRSGKTIRDLERQFFTRSGRLVQVLASTYPIWDRNKIVGAFSITRNITRIREMFSKTLELQQHITAGVGGPGNGTRYNFSDIIAESISMQAVIKEAKKAALTPFPILIQGETGTGKELFVQSIHNASLAKEHPFIGINCASMPESLLESLLFGTVKGSFTGAENTKGLFEQAENGTLFLDEINSMPLSFQMKLLRAIQEKTIRRIGGIKEIPINCRIISSTNEDLSLLVDKGLFRKDLFFRIAVIVLSVPPLRERQVDVALLARYFSHKYARVFGNRSLSLSDDFLRFLLDYDWPGNVREMEHVFESTIALLDEEDQLTVNHLPGYLRAKLAKGQIDALSSSIEAKMLNGILKEVEKKVLLEALDKYHWNITQAGRSIGIGRQNMQYRMNKLGIVPRSASSGIFRTKE